MHRPQKFGIDVKRRALDSVVSVLTFRSDDVFISDTILNTQKIFFTSILAYLIILFLFYKKFKSKIDLEEIVDERTKELKKEKIDSAIKQIMTH